MTKEQEAKATIHLCVFCGRTYDLDTHVCSRCKEYKGIVLARECQRCGTPTFVEDDDCPDCGANMA
jgi:ribosomal protein L37E